MKLPAVCTDADVIAAIRAEHLVSDLDGLLGTFTIHWSKATVDAGVPRYHVGPYLHVPVTRRYGRHVDSVTYRLFAPARLRRRLAKRWRPTA